MSPCGRKYQRSRNVMGKRKTYKEQRDVLYKSTRNFDECDMENNSETIFTERNFAIVGDGHTKRNYIGMT